MYVHGGNMVFQKYLRCLIGPDITLRNVYQVCNGTWYLLLKYYQAKWRFCLDILLKFTQRCRHTHHPYFLHSLGVPHNGNETNDRREQCHANKSCEQNSKRTWCILRSIYKMVHGYRLTTSPGADLTEYTLNTE